MIVAAVIAGIVVGYTLVLGMCRAAAPQTDEERRYDDEAQMAALAKQQDWCDPHGIPRPEELARLYGHPSAGAEGS